MPLGGGASLTLSAEARLRYDGYDNAQLTRDNDYRQTLFRGVLGADLRLDRHLRLYGEVAAGQVGGRRDAAAANFQNQASLQQLFVDVCGQAGATVVGAMLGRQEFADGPRQLISLSDGPNIHRVWNGVRLYAHANKVRFGAFALRATRLDRGVFDEQINGAERISGINGSVVVSPGRGPNTYLDPFWIRSENRNFRAGGASGVDMRDTVGARLWVRSGDVRFDWTLAHQSGQSMLRDVDAWGVFAVHSVALSDEGWKPRLTGACGHCIGRQRLRHRRAEGLHPALRQFELPGRGAVSKPQQPVDDRTGHHRSADRQDQPLARVWVCAQAARRRRGLCRRNARLRRHSERPGTRDWRLDASDWNVVGQRTPYRVRQSRASARGRHSPASAIAIGRLRLRGRDLPVLNRHRKRSPDPQTKLC